MIHCCKRFEEVLTNYQEGEISNMCEVLDRIEARKEAEVNERVATDMLKDNCPLALIEKYSKLSEETIRKIAKGLNITVVV